MATVEQQKAIYAELQGTCTNLQFQFADAIAELESFESDAAAQRDATFRRLRQSIDRMSTVLDPIRHKRSHE